MSNINDYLLWRGDIPISSNFKFNEVDSMILARFAYLIFSKIEMNSIETIESISKKMRNFENKQFRYNGDKELVTNLGTSTRFKDMIVTDFEEINEIENEKQFGAITVHISDTELYISFLGTDSSIYGWKEDFNMAFMDNVPCQLSGKEYLEKIEKKYPNKKIRIGGHSKGGNVAIYSAITATKDIQEKIIKVYNYDGPGFNKNIILKFENDAIIDNIETYIPQESIIGRIMNHKEKITIVLSTEKGILQHDIYSWQVLKDDVVSLEKNTEISEDINQTITNWLETTTNEQRKIFFDSVFELLYSTNSNSFLELSKNLSTNLPIILKKYGEISKEEKELISNMLKGLVTNYLKIIKERQYLKLNNQKEIYKEKGKKQLEKFEILNHKNSKTYKLTNKSTN